MKKITKIIHVCCAALFVLLCTFVAQQIFSSPTYAAEENEIPDYRLGIAPGQNALGEVALSSTHTGSFKVKNTGKKTISFELSISPYSVTNDDKNEYDTNFVNETSYTEMTEWISTAIKGGTLEPNEEVMVDYSVKIPADVHGGAQSAAIMVTMKGEEDNEDNGIQAVRQLAYIVYANVDGEINRSAKILENNIPGIILNPDLQVSSLVENSGNVYGVAEYKVQVFPLFSDEEVYTNEEKPELNVIFPETKRYYAITWEDTPSLGIYRVRQTVKLFDEESVVEKLVFIIPLWLIIIILVIIFLAVFWIISRIRSRKER